MHFCVLNSHVHNLIIFCDLISFSFDFASTAILWEENRFKNQQKLIVNAIHLLSFGADSPRN